MIEPRSLKEAFEDFSRNERWGTCSGCPTDGNGRKIPELCVDTKRYDHQLSIEQLRDAYYAYKRK